MNPQRAKKEAPKAHAHQNLKTMKEENDQLYQKLKMHQLEEQRTEHVKNNRFIARRVDKQK